MAPNDFAGKARLFGSVPIERVCLAGISAAAIDAAYFSLSALLRGHSPLLVLQSIASFWLGKASMNAGVESMILGAATHLGLATMMAAGFAVVRLRVIFLTEFPLIGGALYGLCLYCVMYLVVLPLRWPDLYPRWDGTSSGLDLAVHIAIGIAIARVIRSPLKTLPMATAPAR